MKKLSAQNALQEEATMTVRVPITIRKRGGRRVVLAPDGAVVASSVPRRTADTTVVKALGRAFRWRKLLEDGTYATIEDIAAAEKINTSYISRILRLTLLAPQIIESILVAKQESYSDILKPFPIVWDEQQTTLRAEAMT